MNIIREADPTCVGIDFGTTTSSVALFDGQLRFVEFTNLEVDGDSRIAKSQVNLNGKICSNLKDQISRETLSVDSATVTDCGQPVHGSADIEEIVEFLRSLRKETNQYFYRDIRNCVITVPARFNDIQRQYTVEAATKAGWQVVRVLAEPTAAFVAYSLLHECSDGTYGVYDLGGGTFDFTVIRKDGDALQVIATEGDLEIGGNHFDSSIARNLGVSLAEARLLRESGSVSCNKLLEKTVQICKRIMPSDADGIILAGGCGHMAYNLLAHDFRVVSTPDPRLLVCAGAAIHARKMAEEKYLLIDVLPVSIGIEIMNGISEIVLRKNTPLPASSTVSFTNVDERQTHILFHVVQGESDRVQECRSLGDFRVKINPAPPRTVHIKVNLQVDTDGIISIDCESPVEKVHLQLNSTKGLTPSMAQDLNASSRNDMLNQIIDQIQILDPAGRYARDFKSVDEAAKVLEAIQIELSSQVMGVAQKIYDTLS